MPIPANLAVSVVPIADQIGKGGGAGDLTRYSTFGQAQGHVSQTSRKQE